jgi:4-hydroxybenzoate polyprenyltransferase
MTDLQTQQSDGVTALIRRWGEMVKFSHSVFALPFALIAAFMAARAGYAAQDVAHPFPSPGQLVLIVVCMVSARSVAMTFNRIVDAKLDARNPRTAGRAIPAGTISRRQAMVFLGASSAVFVIACGGFWWLDGNDLPLKLAMPVLLYLCFYSYTKRFTQWSHFVLGSAIALSPVAAWIAIHPDSLGWPAVVLMGAVTLWIGGFDIIYACQDDDVDRRDGLLSLPARMGRGGALMIARLAHMGTVALLVLLAPLAHLGWLYAIGVGVVAVLLVTEHAMVRANDLSRVNLAFFTINGVISLLMGALAVADVLLGLGDAVPWSS